jgi:opacity protein-like surface antigen
MVNGLYNFLPRDAQWRPFATFGIGLSRFSPTADARNRALQDFLSGPTRISSSTEFGFNFGGGVEKAVTERIGIRFDLRDNVTGMPRFGLPEAPLNPGGAFYPVKGVIHDFEVAAGVVFHFD